ncbi:MAG: L,D-transpeptidase [Verrucomicrobiales bacterium]|nr:L,D-transpeptidase [Verrucomicrobiales bacterium]
MIPESIQKEALKRPATSRASMAAVLFVALFVMVPVSEAGLFEKLKAKRQAKLESLKPKPKPKPRPVHRSSYRDAHGDAYINEELLAIETEADRRIIVDVKRQRAFLVVNDLIAIDSAVSTARRGKYTPRGEYPITEKIRSGKVSTIYHVYMPNWMRLGHSTVGMHTGDLPGYPASAGCIRLPQSVAPILFEHVERGVRVSVVDFWDEQGLKIPYSTPGRDLYAAL